LKAKPFVAAFSFSVNSVFSVAETKGDSMILEVAILHIKPEDISKFEAVFPKVEPIFRSVAGYISHELQRCVETKGRYHFLIRWETIEAHTVNFRQSAKFQEFRGLVGGFFAQPPVAEHFERVTASKL
jgi:heme-degrading monooxygenase HmoA